MPSPQCRSVEISIGGLNERGQRHVPPRSTGEAICRQEFPCHRQAENCSTSAGSTSGSRSVKVAVGGLNERRYNPGAMCPVLREAINGCEHTGRGRKLIDGSVIR